MQIIKSIISLFTSDFSDSGESEDFSLFEIRGFCYTVVIPSKEAFETATEFLKNDGITIHFSVGDNEAESYSSSIGNYSQFSRSLKIKLDNCDHNEIVHIKLIINKNFDQGISVYSIDKFGGYINSLTIQQLLKKFGELLYAKEQLFFRCLELTESFSTSSFIFTPYSANLISGNAIVTNKAEKLYTIYSSVHSSSSFKPILLPEEFILPNNSNIPPTLKKTFNDCAFFLLVLSLFDVTSIVENELEFKLNGYKSIKGRFLRNYASNSFEEFKAIYDWVYTDGNLVDKIGLARNIISLHIDNVDKLTIKGSPYQSIISNYQIYQKQNIKQYIEIRNKISDQLVDFNKRAIQIVDGFASGYQKSALTLVTFFSSLVALKFLSTAALTMTFSLNAFILSNLFLLVSFVYKKFLKKETIEQKRRFDKSYINMKIRYTDLLTKEDINKILNGDLEHNLDREFIKDKIRLYTKIWNYTIAAIFLVTIMLFLSGAYETIKNMSDVFIFGYLKSL